MKTIIKEHPLKNIILDFDESKVAPDYEKEALELYYEAHDVVQVLKEKCQVMEADLKTADLKISDLYAEGLLLEQELDIIEDGLGLKAEEDMTPIEVEMTIDITSLIEKVSLHNQVMQDFYDLIDSITTRHNAFLDMLETDEFGGEYPVPLKYLDLFGDIYPRYEELCVDIVTLDEDEDKFRGAFGKVCDLYDNNLDFTTEVIDNYYRLYYFTDDLYRRTERVNDILQQKVRDMGLEE